VRNLTEDEKSILLDAWDQRGEIFFPVSSSVAGALTGSLNRRQKMINEYHPSLSERIVKKLSESFRCISQFLDAIDTENVFIFPDYRDGKEGVWIRKTNKESGQ